MARGKWKRQPCKGTPEDVRQHVTSCKTADCACQSAGHRLPSLQEKCQLISPEVLEALQEAPAETLAKAQDLLGVSWLNYEFQGEPQRMLLGCSVCSGDKGVQFTTQQAAAANKLSRHGSGPEHVRNVCKLLGYEVPTKETAAVRWPGAEVVLQVFRQLQGDTTDRFVEGVSAEKKTSRIEWCIVEATREQWRESLRNAVSICLLRDERHKRVLLRFRAVDKTLQVTNGVLGQLKGDYSSTALGLTAATLRVIREFATPGLARPGMKGEELQLEVDESLVQHIRECVLSTTIDAAGNEVAAVQDSAAPLEVHCQHLAEGETLFPNHKLIVRDRAHGTRRVLERPWRADPFLDAVMTSLITGSSSVTQLIEHSFDFKQWFSEASKASMTRAVATPFRNLRSALHRYESLVTPLSRFVLDLEAVLAVATRMVGERAGTNAAHCAEAFLDAMDSEVLLTAALLADAGDEALQLIRWMDQDENVVDAARANIQVKKFLDSIRLLFNEGRVLAIKGHTQCMLTWLSSPHVLAYNSKVKALGGPTACPVRLQQACLRRLQVWAALAEETVKAEFPEFEAVAAMRVLNVCDPWPSLDALSSSDSENIPPDACTDLERLAQSFDCNFAALKVEWMDFRGRARWHAVKSGCTNICAWKKAIDESQEQCWERRETAARHPCQHLNVVLCGYASTCISDSALERSFSQAAAKIPASARHLHPQKESLRMSFLALKEDDVRSRMEVVANLWKQHFGSSRQGAFDRIDQGRAKPTKAATEDRECYREFIKARRKNVAEVVQKNAPAESASVCDGDAWLESHQKELEFNRDKRKKRKFEALFAGALLEDEMDLTFLHDAAEVKATTQKNRRARQRKEQRLQSDMTAGKVPSVADMRDCHVYMLDRDRTPAVDNLAIGLGWTWAADPCSAQICLTDLSGVHSDGVPTSAIWAAAMQGAWVMSPAWALGGDYTGPALKFLPPLRTKRFLWISPDLAESAVAVCDVLRRCASTAGSKWIVVNDLEAWLEKKQDLTQKSNAAAAIAAVTTEEASMYSDVPHVFDLSGFFQFVCRLDKQKSRLALGLL
ncbi:unnamed protein product [Symbiodinium sp. CCMP2592]|nr:unnamed protein product [Symbiodinium sp. CCMP2592]CAE7666800.1 unnamed protein product [Symbiodinium sp. CCMP2592]